MNDILMRRLTRQKFQEAVQMKSKIDSPDLKVIKDGLKAKTMDLQLAVILDKPERVMEIAEEIAILVPHYLELKGVELV